MRIRIRPAGIIRRYAEDKDMEVCTGLTIRGLIDLLCIPPELKLMVFINGQRKGAEEVLEDEDEVRLITLLSGG